MKTRTGTEERRRRPPSHLRGKWRFFYCHLPCGWLRLSTKTRFSLSRFRRGARGRVARRGIPAPPTPTAGAWLRKGSTPAWAAAGWRDVAWGGECDESAASPLIISTPRPLIAALHQAPDGSGCVREEGRCNSQVWRRVMRHTPEVNGASHRRCYMPVAPLLWRPVSSPCMHAGVLVGPGRERWGIGCRRRRELPDPRSGRGPHPRDGRRARMPGRLDPSSAAVDLEVDEAAGKAAVPRAPDLGGERVRPPDSAPCLDPSFQNTAPPSQPAQHNEDTRFPLLFWTLYSPWTLLLYYFCLIKASPRPDATPTVSVVCSSRHTR